MTSSDLYMEFFGFSERPFTLLPDPDFLFWSRAHRRAFSVLEYGVLTRAPITVVTGEVGVGKTTLVQKLLQALDEDITCRLASAGDDGDGARVDACEDHLVGVGVPAGAAAGQPRRPPAGGMAARCRPGTVPPELENPAD